MNWGNYKGDISGFKFEAKPENRLAPAEEDFVYALRSIASKYGKLADGDENGIWVGYESQAENENYKIGVKCSNCAFYESENVCQIIKAKIEPGGYCRLAAIPPGLVKKSGK
jgi:hypothetical protein